MQENKDKLQKIHYWAYGMGHFINDLVVACWFNFLLYFLKRVAETPVASYVLFIGQVTDGLTTPLVGFFSDKFDTRFGQENSMVFHRRSFSISILFASLHCGEVHLRDRICILCGLRHSIQHRMGGHSDKPYESSTISNFGSQKKGQIKVIQDRLNNLRNFFTFASNLIVLSLGLVIFTTVEDNKVGFFMIASAALLLGMAASIFFLCVIKEKQLVIQENTGIRQQNESLLTTQQKDKQLVVGESHSNWKWFRMPTFYLFGICYMGVRIYTNMFGTLLPFYLVGVLNLGSHEQSGISFNIALVPLICYFSSVLAASRLSWFYANVGRKKALMAGTVICILSMGVVYLLTVDFSWVIYFVSIFIGVSQAMVLGTGINLISQVVGQKGNKGAFVFGIYSFCDKITVGVIIYLVSNTESYTKTTNLNQSDIDFIKLTLVLISGGGCLLGALIVLLHPIPQYREKKLTVQQKYRQ